MSSQVSAQVPSVRPAPPPPDLRGPLSSAGSLCPETSNAVSQPESDPPHIPTFSETRQELDGISLGKETYKDPESGSLKISIRNQRLVAQDMWNETLKHFKARGEFFRAPRPLYVDNVRHKLFDFSSNSPQMATVLRGLGYIPHNGYCPSVQRALEDYAATSPVRDCDHISHMTPDAIYINSGEGKMLKITTDSFTEVPLGTDDVVLLDDDLAPWPTLDVLKPIMDELRPAIGTACTKSIPDLPLSKNLSGRWSQDSPLSPSQAQQMFITHLLFTFACSLCSLWPLQLHTGDQDSGKTTPFELFLTLLSNRGAHATMMPGKERDLIAAITNSPVIVFDNIDGAKLDDPSRSNYQDYICGMATGAHINMAKLFHDNVRDKYKLHNHGFFTARVNPFTRPDVLRRCIHLEMAPPVLSETIDKDVLKNQVLESRLAILAEIALRAQNILRAHQTRKTYLCQSEMSEYENFTLRCAEYEGTLEETKHLWSNYLNQYRHSITASNPLVLAARLWIGKGNARRQVSPATLFVEMQTVFMETGQKFLYTSSAGFGKHIAANLRPLQVLGFRTIPTRGNQDYIFEPSLIEEERCGVLYKDYVAATSKRSISSGEESWFPDDDSSASRGTAKVSEKETVQ